MFIWTNVSDIYLTFLVLLKRGFVQIVQKGYQVIENINLIYGVWVFFKWKFVWLNIFHIYILLKLGHDIFMHEFQLVSIFRVALL